VADNRIYPRRVNEAELLDRARAPDHGPARSDPADLGEPVSGTAFLEPWLDEPVAVEPGPDARYLPGRAGRRDPVAELKAGDGGDILVFGSRTLWHDLLLAGLVDGLHLMVGPQPIGAGTPALPALPEPLRLLESRTRHDSDNVLIRYDATPRD
jgi:hypothetical protein